MVRRSFFVFLFLIVVLPFFISCGDSEDTAPNPYANLLAKLPSDLTTEQYDILNVVHNIAFTELYRNGGYYKINETIDDRVLVDATNYTIAGSQGGSATIASAKDFSVNPSCDAPRKHSITFNNYQVNDIVVNGSFWWYTGITYKDLDAPPVRRSCYIYLGGGAGGSLVITGKYNKNVTVTPDFINMVVMNNTDYWDDNALVIKYQVDERVVPIKIEMLANAYRKTFKKAFNDLVEADSGSAPSITVSGADGGSAVWSVATSDAGSGNTRRQETITFNNYADNGVVINDSFSFVSIHVNGDPANIVSGGDSIGFTSITGYRNGIAFHNVKVYKPASVWNFSLTYYVEELSFQFVFIRLGMSFSG